MREQNSVLQVMESWAVPGNEASTLGYGQYVSTNSKL